MIDADGHVLEQLELPPEVQTAFFDADARWHDTGGGGPGADRGVARRAHVRTTGRVAARSPARGHGRRRDRHRGALPDDARAGVGARRRHVPHDGPGVQPLAARVLLRRSGAPHRRRPRARCRTRARGQGDGALRAGARLQGGDDPARAVHRQQEAERPGVRPVLGRRRAARLPDRRPPLLVRRHAVERRDPPRPPGRRRRAAATRVSRCARVSGTRST